MQLTRRSAGLPCARLQRKPRPARARARARCSRLRLRSIEPLAAALRPFGRACKSKRERASAMRADPGPCRERREMRLHRIGVRQRLRGLPGRRERQHAQGEAVAAQRLGLATRCGQRVHAPEMAQRALAVAAQRADQAVPVCQPNALIINAAGQALVQRFGLCASDWASSRWPPSCSAFASNVIAMRT